MQLHRRLAAFTRTELLITIVVVIALVGVATVFVQSYRRKARDNSCAGNLRQLGVAYALYAQQDQGRLPYAYIRYNNFNHSTWDTLLEQYLRLGARETASGTVTNKLALPMLLCPADKVPMTETISNKKTRYQRRSYSMSGHDMSPENWPPSAANSTGVGLGWSFGAKGEQKPRAEIYDFENTNRQQSVTLAMIPAPAATLLTTELIDKENVSFLSHRSFIGRTADHIKTKLTNDFQMGRLNYLMIDGHVENLLPEQTVGPKGQAGNNPAAHQGIWTIKAGD